MKRWVHLAAGMVLGIALVATCGDGRVGSVVDMGMDALGLGDGATVGDGQLLDIAGAEAQPLPNAMMVNCDQMATMIYTTPIGANLQTVTQDFYLADIQSPGLDPTTAPSISVVLCDYEFFGGLTDALLNCPSLPDGGTCSVTGFSAPSPRCQTGGASLVNGRIVVFCGSRARVSYNGTTTDSGNRARTAYVRVN